MSTIVLKSVKGAGLTNSEIDANFSNLNADKLEAAALTTERTAVATLANKTLTSPALTTQFVDVVTNNLPTIRPTLNLDFANSGTVSPLVTYTGSGRMFTNSKGLLELQASNVPRIEYNPATGECLGLSVYGASTNLFTRSQEFDHADWSKTNLAITANATTAPDGTTTADKLVETAVNGGHYTEQIKNNTVTAPVTVSWFVKAGERTIVNLENYSNPTSSRLANVQFNASTGVFDAITVQGGASNASTKVETLPGGWYRISLTVTFGGSDTQSRHRVALHNGANTVYTGDGTSGIFVWGAQLEAGTVPSPYIPTTTAAVTAPADIATIDGSNFTKWFNPVEGTLLVASKVARDVPRAWHAALSADGGASSTDTVAIINGFANPSQRRLDVNVASVSQAQPIATSAAPASSAFAAAYKANDFAISMNGGAAVTDAAGSLPVVNALCIGSRFGSGDYCIDGTISRVTYWPKRLPNATLQAITA